MAKAGLWARVGGVQQLEFPGRRIQRPENHLFRYHTSTRAIGVLESLSIMYGKPQTYVS